MNEPKSKKSLLSNPFPGIDPFSYAAREVFFSRSAEVRTLIRKVVIYRGVLLYSDSGTGKSSLINAGLIPLALEEGFQPERIRVQPKLGEEFIVERISEQRPGEPPYLPSLFARDESHERVVLGTKEFLEIIRNPSPDSRPLLIFDQFEEWVTLFEEGFTGNKAREARKLQERVLEVITAIINDEKLPVKVLLSFREDYHAKLKPFYERCPNLPDQDLRLQPLKSAQVREVIRGPFERYPGMFQPEISDSLASSIQKEFENRSGGGAINLTEVQIVCRFLYDSGKSSREMEPYFHQAGGVQGIIEAYLEDTLEKLADHLRDPAVALLSRMVTSAGTRNIISREDLISRVKNEEGLPTELLTEALDSLDQQTRLVQRRRQREVYYYEIASEFLVDWIREKSRRRQYLVEKRKFEETQRKLMAEARRARQFRWMAIFMFVLAVLAILISLYAVNQRKQARDYAQKVDSTNTELTHTNTRLNQTLIELNEKEDSLKQVNTVLDSKNVQLGAALTDLETKQRQVIREKTRADNLGKNSLARQLASAAISNLTVDPELSTLLSLKALSIARANYVEADRMPEIRSALHRSIQEMRQEQVFEGPGRALWDIALSPDGTTLVTADANGRLNFWDVASGKKLLSINAHNNQAYSLDFSSNGKYLVSAGRDMIARLWDLQTATEIRTYTEHRNSIFRVAVSPDGRYIATASADSSVKIWSTQSDSSLQTITGHWGWVEDVHFSSDSSRLITAGDDGYIHIWNYLTGERLGSLPRHPDVVMCSQFSPDGNTIATGGYEGVVRIWNSRGDSLIHTFDARGDSLYSGITRIIFSPDGQYIAAASFQGKINVWDLSARQRLYHIDAHKKMARGLIFSRDGKQIYSCGEDGLLRSWAVSSGKELFTRAGDAGRVTAVASSPDGEYLATAGEMGTVKVWSRESGMELLRFSGHDGAIWTMTYSHDGSRVATGGEDGKVKIWNAVSGEEIFSFKEHNGTVWGIDFSPDDLFFASAGGDGLVKIWDLYTGEVILTLSDSNYPLYSLAYSHDGTRIAAGNSGGVVHIWNSATGREIRILHDEGSLYGLAFSPDDQLLAVGSWKGHASVWSINQGEKIRSLSRHTGPVARVAFSPDGRRLATASRDNTAKVWNLSSGEELISLSGHDYAVWDLAFSPDGNHLLTGSWDGSARLWNVGPPTEPTTYSPHLQPVRSLAFSPNGKRIASVGDDWNLEVWDVETGEIIKDFWWSHFGVINSVEFSPDGSHVVTGGGDGLVKITDVATEKERTLLPDHTDPIFKVTYSPSGKYVAVAGADKLIYVVDVVKEEVVSTLTGHTDYVFGAEFHPNEKWLVSGSRDETVKIWDWKKEKPIISLRAHQDGVWGVAVSPDGKYFATAGGDGIARIWSFGNWKEIHQLQGHSNIITSVDFNPSGERLTTASWDKTIKLWDVSSGMELLTLTGHTDRVLDVKFSPNGKLLASCGKDTTVRIHHLDLAELGRLALLNVNRTFSASEVQKYFRSFSAEADPAYFILEAKKYGNIGDRKNSTVYFQKVLEIEPTIALVPEREATRLVSAAFWAKARHFARRGERDSARIWFEKINELKPANRIDAKESADSIAANWMVSSAKNHAQTGSYLGFLNDLVSIGSHELQPWFSKWEAQGHLGRGRYFARAGQMEKAIGFFQEAIGLDSTIKIDPHAEAARYSVSFLLEESRRLAEAGKLDNSQTLLERALEIDSTLQYEPKTQVDIWAAPYFLRQGEMLADQGDYKAAMKLFDKVRQLNPDLLTDDPQTLAKKRAIPALQQKADSLLKHNRVDQALDYYQEAISLDPTQEYFSTLDSMRQAFHEAKLDTVAIRQLKKISKKYSNNIQPLFQLSYIYHEYLSPDKKSYRKALHYIKKALALEPENSFLQQDLVEKYFTTAQYSDSWNLAEHILQAFFNYRSDSLNMYFFITASRLAGEKADSSDYFLSQYVELLERNLRDYYDGSYWVFNGTRKYVETYLSGEEKNIILSLIDLLEMKIDLKTFKKRFRHLISMREN
ncbi:MAG: hypothetical protein Kow0042_22880 [Calditrichia bacterium]